MTDEVEEARRMLREDEEEDRRTRRRRNSEEAVFRVDCPNVTITLDVNLAVILGDLIVASQSPNPAIHALGCQLRDLVSKDRTTETCDSRQSPRTRR